MSVPGVFFSATGLVDFTMGLSSCYLEMSNGRGISPDASAWKRRRSASSSSIHCLSCSGGKLARFRQRQVRVAETLREEIQQLRLLRAGQLLGGASISASVFMRATMPAGAAFGNLAAYAFVKRPWGSVTGLGLFFWRLGL